MAKRTLKQYRSRDASLWQSAVEAEFGKTSSAAAGLGGGGPARRADQPTEVMSGADEFAEAIANERPIPQTAPPTPAAGIKDVAKFCAGLAARAALARLRGDGAEAKRLESQLTQRGGSCDPRWARVLADFVANRLRADQIPYRRHKTLDDFVVADGLPENGTVALLADWGTGQNGAAELLRSIRAKSPDVVVHLGDVYFSGTEREFRDFFYALWQRELGLPNVPWGAKPAAKSKPATYTLCGNHDLYAGGAPYYRTIDTLGQPASYFCLRNQHWQVIAIDTGLHDSNPVGSSVTFLEDTELAWLKHQTANAGGRKTILLSHHQLFSAIEKIGDSFVNPRLEAQLKDVLPQVTAWFWGHEHNLIIYGHYFWTRARCIGHGACPVGRDEDLGIKVKDVPVEKIKLSLDRDGTHFQHGYALLQFNGPAATVRYIEYDELTDQERELHTETL